VFVKRSCLDLTSGYNLIINLPRPTGDMLFPILDWMSRSDICPVLSSLILALNLGKIDINAAYSGETENTNLKFFGLTYKRRTKCWSLRLDISSRRQYLCTYTYGKCLGMGCIYVCHKISRNGYLCDTI
jgi:hypothetical protein